MTSSSPSQFRRTTHNVLVVDHRVDRMPEDQVSQNAIFTKLEEVIVTLRSLSHGELRVITGHAEEVDQRTAEIASEHSIPFHLIVPCFRQEEASIFSRAQRIARISSRCEQQPDDAWIAAADEAKLALADVVVIIWDGRAHEGNAAKSARLLIDTMERYTPVLWIDSRPEHAGQIWISDTEKLNAPMLAMLGADEANIERFHKLFTLIERDLKSALNQALTPFWNIKHLRNIEKELNNEQVDPKGRKTLYGKVHSHLFWLIGFFSKEGQWPRKKRAPVFAFRGPQEFQQSTGLPESVWLWFDRFDRAAVHMSNKHRDQIVLVQAFAGAAVLCAAAGAINWLLLGKFAWAMFELLALFFILALVRRSHRRDDHAGWLRYRQAAETLRMNMLLHPMLTSMPSLQRGVWDKQFKAEKHTQTETLTLIKPYHWLIIQLLRDAGLPGDKHHYSLDDQFTTLRDGLAALIDDQKKYHETNDERCHVVHYRLHRLTMMVFFLVITTVLTELLVLGTHLAASHGISISPGIADLTHWIHEQQWLLLITAFFPPLAAGLHNIMVKFELQRLATSSRRMCERLGYLGKVVSGLKPEDGPMILRGLALATTVIMNAEHDAWAELMKDQAVEIPA